MKINIGYFAALREVAGKESECLDLEIKTAIDLYAFLKKKYDFTYSQEQLRVAINDCYSEFNEQLKDGDKIVFIPPVAGG